MSTAKIFFDAMYLRSHAIKVTLVMQTVPAEINLWKVA